MNTEKIMTAKDFDTKFWNDNDVFKTPIWKELRAYYDYKLANSTETQMNKLILNMPFVSLNEYVDAERSSRQYAAKIKKQQTNSVYYLTRSQKFKLDPKKYDVIFTWFKPDDRKDHDNICFAKKFILDGIVKAGVLPNDNPRYIGNFQDKIVLDKTRKYVSCQVEFIESIHDKK